MIDLGTRVIISLGLDIVLIVIDNAKWDIVDGILMVTSPHGKPIAAYKEWAYINEEGRD